MRQTQALQVMMSGQSVFLTGPPGAGKTYVLNEFIRRANRAGKRVAVTASTGIAATHIGGTTIHSWSGLGVREALSEWDRERLLSTERLVKRYNATDVLVIDEVSMLHGRLLDMVNETCKLLRQDMAPFGGLQVVLVGDLFQLPPVSRGGERLDFVHNSAAWADLDPQICYITEQHRQEQDSLLDLLNAMRCGDVNELHEVMLGERLHVKPDDTTPITRLYAHNADVETINQQHLDAIDARTKLFIMQTKGAASKVEQLTRSVLAPESLELKPKAEVMFVANNFAAGFVNGSRGRVVGFSDDLPIVELASSGREVKVEPHTWTLSEDGSKRAEATQLPLRLAWAITIHKSQGMSLDAAEIDLSRSFTPGMGYVALSRVRSIDGVYLKGVNQMALAMHPDIYTFDAELRAASDNLAEQTDDIADEPAEAATAGKPPAAVGDQALLAKLKQWRLERARNEGVAPYMVAHNAMLDDLAAHPPLTTQALRSIKGFGPKKMEAYGDDIIKLLMDHGVRIDAPTSAAGAPIDVVKPTAQPGTAWSSAEDARLLGYFKSGTPLAESARLLGRAPDELWARLTDLRSR